MPNLVLVQPSSEDEVGPLLDWCIDTHDGPGYIRLVSVPCIVNFSLPPDYKPVLGQGGILADGKDAVIFAYGPTMLGEAIKAAENIGRRGGSVRVINMPWLNRVDSEWLVRAVEDIPLVLTVDDHYLAGGQGEMLASAFTLARPEVRPRWVRIGLTEVPRSGANDEVLRHHRMDSASIEQAILSGQWS
jgi:transketolase